MQPKFLGLTSWRNKQIWLVRVERASILDRIIAKACATSFCHKDIFVSKQAKLQRSRSPFPWARQHACLLYSSACLPPDNNAPLKDHCAVLRKYFISILKLMLFYSFFFFKVYDLTDLTVACIQNHDLQILYICSSKLCSEKFILME